MIDIGQGCTVLHCVKMPRPWADMQRVSIHMSCQVGSSDAVCMSRCNLLHLLDSRFAGIARGVGEGKILGRIHSVREMWHPHKHGIVVLHCVCMLSHSKQCLT